MGSEMCIRDRTDTSHTITVTATTTDGQTATQDYTINITDVAEGPSIPDVVVTKLESITAGTSITTFSDANTNGNTDSDGDAITYSITGGNTDSTFAIDASTGEVTLASNKSLSYASQSVWSLTITASSDSGNKTDTATLTLNVSNVTSAPVFDTSTSGTSKSIAENTTPGSTIGLTVEADPASGDSASIASFDITASVDNSNADSMGTFAIDPSSGVVTLAKALDYETDTSLSLIHI